VQYTPWDELLEKLVAVMAALYYNQSKWENYGTNLNKEMHYTWLTR
jgi:hypothetical protein